ncbi:MAG: tetratricopeptide repeat protein, partial [Nannocystaceae bacterium]
SPVKIRITDPLSSLVLSGVLEHLLEEDAKRLLESDLDKYPQEVELDDEKAIGDVLTRAERKFITQMTGNRTVAAVLETAKEYGLERPTALMHGMVAIGGLELLSEPDTERAPRDLGPSEHHDQPDDFFKPEYEPSEAITEYEDTPLPGTLPSTEMEMSDEDEAMFAGVEDSKLAVLSELEGSDDVVGQAVEEIVEVEEIEEIEEDSSLELVDIENVEDVDLNVDGAEEEDDGMAGAIHFARGESAFAEGDWDAAVEAFEDAYETGVDVAELHAMLAFSRYRTAEDDPEMVEHVIELLAYAEDLDPKLDSIYAFQGVVQLFGRGDKKAAKACFNRAIELNPYCDLALEYIDQV